MDSGNLKKDIQERLGRVPVFFKPVLEQPALLSLLWSQVKESYLDNPAPALFKEKLLARLGRYCPSPYCLVSHSASLKNLGMSAQDIWDFLKKPAPALEEDARRPEGAAPGWPAPGSAAEARLLELSELAFLHPGGSAQVRADIRRLTGGENFERLWSLISFGRLTHFWLDFHRDVSYEDDPGIRDAAAALSDEEPMLADFFRNYADVVQRDRRNLEDRLVNEIDRRRQMQEELTRYAAEMEESRDRMQEQASNNAKLAEELYKRREELLLEITERKKVEESIRVYVEIVRNMPIGLNVWQMENPQDPRTFRLIATNPSVKRFTGVDLGSSIGKNMLDIFPYLSEIPNLYAEVISTGKPKELGESAYGGEDGTPEGFFSIRVFPLPNHCVGVGYEDITERKEAEQELSYARDAALELARTRSEFLANMSHEIRTPLNAILGTTNLLLESGLSEEDREMALTASHAGDALLGIVNEILDFSKMESGKMSLESVDFDLGAVVEGALELLRARAQAKGLGLSAMYDEGVPTALRGDPTRLRQVLINLVANAVKFTEKGEVVVRASLVKQGEGEAELKIAVSDTGIGIPPESLRKLFQAFAQADTSTTRKYGGTGLGLAISKRIVELMGGEIGVESEVGSGSTFWCRIKFDKARGTSAAGPSKDRLADTPALIVDMDATGRQILHHYALSWKMKADALASETKALDLLHQRALAKEPYRVLLLDMGGAEGLAFALKIKTDPALTGLRVVAVTPPGKGLEPDVRRAAGIAASVSKPVKETALFNALLEALSGGPAAPRKDAAKKRFFRILLVEDNPVNQRVAQLQLGKLGYTADVASSGEETLKAFDERTYDLIFMDCQMPLMDGFETTAEIRKKESGERHTPIVAMTANALEGDRNRCLAAGMNDYLSKPVDMKKLAEILARWDVTLDPAVLQSLRELAGGETKLVRDVIDQFLKDAPKRLAAIREGARSGDLKALEKASHALKGASGNIGAKALWAICEKIEEMAREGSTDKIGAPLGVLEEEFGKLEEELEKEKKK